MNDMKQPEALRLAEWLELHAIDGMERKAAAELRRLHAENEQLRAALEAVGTGGVGPMMPRKPLTPDVSGVDGVNARLHFRRGWKSAERAHGIEVEA